MPQKLFNLPAEEPFIFLETAGRDRENKKSYLFNGFNDILIFNSGDSPDLFFKKIEAYLRKGYWLAGYFSYEFGYWLEPAFKDFRKDFGFPLAWIGVCKEPEISKDEGRRTRDEEELVSAQIKNIKSNVSKKEYCDNIARIKDYLKQGLTYQVNYTFKLKFDFSGDALKLYRDLKRKQPTSYCAFIDTGKNKILSFSPELFFRTAKNKIITRPMKGTLGLKDSKRRLSLDPKTKAENIMIVDLLRNDLGRIAKKGTVAPDNLFKVEAYPTLYQMTSTISAGLKKNTAIRDIFTALFPCGSVTGAPKIKTMELIRRLEKEPRNIYCGAIGYISPHGESCFSVAIRTIAIYRGKAEMGVGSGIVYDSVPAAEYDEAMLKAKFLT